MATIRIALTGAFILALCFLSACQPDAPQATSGSVLLRSRVTYGNPEDQKQFKEALKAASIPYEIVVRPDGEYVQWEGKYEDRVSTIQTKLFGQPPPEGRHAGADGPRGEELAAWLTANQIPFTTVVHHGRRYIVWDAKDNDRVANWRCPNDQQPKMTQSPSNSTIDTDARKNCARGSS